MRLTKQLPLSILLCIFLVSFCSGPQARTNTPIMTVESTDVSTTVPENTPTLLLLPTETKPAPTPLPPIKTECTDKSRENQKLDLRGIVSLEKPVKQGNYSEYGFILLNIRGGNIIRDIYEGMFTQVSPDKKYVAYEYMKGDTLFLGVVNGKGETVSDFELSFDGKFVSYFNWQNPEQLRILHEGMGNKLSAKLLNPFSQTSAPLRTNWDGVYAPKNPFEDNLVDWQFDKHATVISTVYGANIFYDPSLTRVLFPKANGVISLVDTESETELASAQLEDWGKLPSWSPDGQYLSILGHEGSADEFYLISRDGNEFQRITNFSEELDFASITASAWSPDSKHIAFWLNTVPGELEDGAQSELAIIDISNRQVTRYCVQGISNFAYEQLWMMRHPEPIWSPDGRYILFTQWHDPTSPKNYDVLVFDTQTGGIRKVSENTSPIGWMSNE